MSMTIDEFNARASAAIAQLKESRELVDQAAGIVAENMKPFTPVRTGALRASIHPRSESARRSHIVSELPYASVQARRTAFDTRGIQASSADIQRLLDEFGEQVLEVFT